MEIFYAIIPKYAPDQGIELKLTRADSDVFNHHAYWSVRDQSCRSLLEQAREGASALAPFFDFFCSKIRLKHSCKAL